jgi:ankyrin repeat protein
MAKELLEAVKRGDAETVRSMVESDPAVAAARDANGVSAILLAHYHGHRDLARMLEDRRRSDLDVFEAAAANDAQRLRVLLSRDPSLANAFSGDGFQPLGLAAFFGGTDAVGVLIERGANVNTPSRNEMKVTPLHSAVADEGRRETAELLIRAGADVNARQRHDWTPLHGAADGGSLALVRLMLDRGADPNIKNRDGKTALDIARERGHEQVAKLLEERVRS